MVRWKIHLCVGDGLSSQRLSSHTVAKGLENGCFDQVRLVIEADPVNLVKMRLHRHNSITSGLAVIRPQSVVSVNVFRSSRDWRSALPLKIHAGSSLLGHVMCVR
jgi:hypothetical protein